jgi:hypothetical protein
MNSDYDEEIRFKRLLSIFSAFLICIIFIICTLIITSCQFVPEISSDLEKVLDNDAVTVKCDKDCFQKDTDVTVHVEIKNKEAK